MTECPECGFSLEYFRLFMETFGHLLPEVEDPFLVCIECGAFLRFNQYLGFSSFDEEDLKKIKEDKRVYEMFRSLRFTVILEKMNSEFERKIFEKGLNYGLCHYEPSAESN